MISRADRGDTIIEVMLAFVVFSLIAVAGISLMNKGAATAQNALEVTLVRQQIDAQAEALRYVRDMAQLEKSQLAQTQWKKLTDHVGAGGLAVPDASSFGVSEAGMCPLVPDSAFFMNAHEGGVIDNSDNSRIISSNSDGSTPYARVVYETSEAIPVRSSGLWVEAVKKNTDQDFIDFHIRACWHTPASSVPATLGTIVRMALI